MRKKFSFKKGSHFSTPRIWQLTWPWRNRIYANVKFTQDSKYTCDDQLDWNKLFGLSWGLPPNKNAAMWAYRYNPNNGYFEITPYINKNFTQIYHNVGDKVLKVRILEPLSLKIEISPNFAIFEVYKASDCKSFRDNKRFVLVKPNTDSPIVTVRQPYHGGNTKPHNDYSLLLNYEKTHEFNY